MKDLNLLQDQLWSWANQNLDREIEGFTLKTCTQSGSIWWQNGDTQLYLDYKGDKLTGCVNILNDITPLNTQDCSDLTSFEQVLDKYLSFSTQVINKIVTPQLLPSVRGLVGQ